MGENTILNKTKHLNKWVIAMIALTSVLVITMAITIVILMRRKEIVLAPDYAPREIEKYAESVGSDNEGKMEQQEGGGAVGLVYSREVEIDQAGQLAMLMFENPAKSNQNILVQIVIRDLVVVQSGLIAPGNRVTKLSLLDGVRLSQGDYEGKFVVYYYHADSGEKAMVNTEIPVHIFVK